VRRVFWKYEVSPMKKKQAVSSQEEKVRVSHVDLLSRLVTFSLLFDTMSPPHPVDDDMFSSLAFDAGAGSGLGTSTLCRSFTSLSGGGFDHDSVQSRASLVGFPVTMGPSLVLVLIIHR